MIREGDYFTVTHGEGRARRVDLFRRELDDPSPRFECERVVLTHLRSTMAPNLVPYSFGTEPEWFRQRRVTLG